MVLAFIWLAAAAVCGVITIYALRLFSEHSIRILTGVVGGISVVTTITYFTSVFTGLTPLLLVSEIVCCLLITAYLAWNTRYHLTQGMSLDTTALGVFALTFLLFGLVISPKLLVEQEDGLATGIINAYGDVAWHAANITAFAEGQSFPPQNPIFGGVDLLYPFMTNFLSAVLIVGGLSLQLSITLVPTILIPVILTLLYCCIREFTGNKTAAIVGVLLFTFGGATLGISRLPQDFRLADTSLWNFLMHLPQRDYSGVGTDENGYHFLNPVTTLLLPQRSFLFGIPLALSILLLLRPKHGKTSIEYIVAGVLAGVLPLFHGHTVLALIPAIVGFFVTDRNIRRWGIFVGVAFIVGLPEVLYYLFGESENGSFFRYSPGWMAGDMNVVWYWIKNTGLLIPVTLIGFALHPPKNVRILAIAGLILFMTANTWLFAPWAWDNFKLFVFFFLFTLPMVAYVISVSLRSFHLAGKVAVILLVIFHMSAAGLDILKLALPTAPLWNEWSVADIRAAEMIRTHTRPGEVILTAPSHNSAVVLAGRLRYLGFAPHVWSHGGNPWIREAAIKPYYQGTLPLLPEIAPVYVLVGPHEEMGFRPIVTRSTWQLIAQSGPHFLYRVLY